MAESAQEALRRRLGQQPTGRLTQLPKPLPKPAAPTRRTTSILKSTVPPPNPNWQEDAERRKADEVFDIVNGGLKANVTGAVREVGAGIKSFPTFLGKGFQTALGFVELTSPKGMVDLASGKSRLTQDWQEGKELGLEGDALVAYAMHRQLPLASDITSSGAMTARHLAELGTGGAYDYGEEGIDLVNAYGRGELGAMLVQDLGNILLAGRLAGAGNLAARAGMRAQQAGAPRLGAAIATTGRFVEEPIGTSARGLGRVVQAGAEQAGRTRLAEAAGRVAAANVDAGAPAGPLRQAVTEVQVAAKQRGNRVFNNIQTRINKLGDERATLQRNDPTSTRIAEITKEIDSLYEKQSTALRRAGYSKKVREDVRQAQIEAEGRRSQFQERSATFATAGVELRPPEVLRQAADRIEADAQSATSTGNNELAAARMAEAERLRKAADIKEQSPGALETPVAKEASPVAHLILDEMVPLVMEMLQDGKTLQEIADLVTSPRVSPDVAMRGYRYTANDIQYLIDYVMGRLDPARAYELESVYNHYAAWSTWFTAEQLAGKGRKQPMSTVALQTTPEPKKIMEIIGRYGDAGQSLLEFLDAELAAYLEQIQPGILEELGITDIKGLFAESAAQDYNTPLFQLANAVVAANYDAIVANPEYGHILRSPDAFPPNMRRELEAEERYLADARGAIVQDQLAALEVFSQQFGDILDAKTKDAIAGKVARLQDTEAVYSPKQYRSLANTIAAIVRRIERRLEQITGSLESLDATQQQLIADLETGYSALNSLEAYLRNLADEPPGPSPRLQQAEAKLRALEEERATLIEEQEQLQGVARGVREADVAAKTERQAQLQGVQDEAQTLGETVQSRTAELETAQREAADADSDLRAFETWSQPENVTALIDDLQTVRNATEAGLSRQVSQAEARAAKEAEVARLDEQVTVASGELEAFLPRSGLQKYDKRSADGQVLSYGLSHEDYVGSLGRWLPDTPEQPWLSEFIDNFAQENGMAIDEAAGLPDVADADARQGTFSESQYLEELGRRYALLKEAEAEAAAARKRPIKQYRDDLARQADDEFANAIDRELNTGMSPAQIERVFKMLQDGPEATRSRLDDATRRAAKLEETLGTERGKLQKLNEQARLLAPDVETRIPTDVGVRLSQVSRRLREIDRSIGRVSQGKQRLGPARRSVEFARRAEPAEAAKAERAKLRGVGRILRPEPGAEGPTGTQILRGVRTKAEQRLERIEGREAANRVVQARLKTQQERTIEAQQAAQQIGEGGAQRLQERMDRPVGPQRVGRLTRTRYMPGGVTGNVRNVANVAVEMRSAGAAPQYKTQAEMARTTGVQPLSLEETSIKIGEITNAHTRHVIVEDMLRDPEITNNPLRLLGAATIERLKKQALKNVQDQTLKPGGAGLLRTEPVTMDSVVVKEEFGRLLAEEISRKGYEPVSRVDVDPETMQHEAVGNLLEAVPPEALDENTFLMRRGMRERIMQQFVAKDASNVPERVQKIAERIGQATGAWKTVVLPFSLRWQVGDLTGNVFNAWALGDIPPDVLIPRVREVVERLNMGRKMLLDATDMISDPVLAALQGAGLQGRGTKLASVAALRDPNANPNTAIADMNMMFGALKGLRQRAFKFNEWQNFVVRSAFAMEKLVTYLADQGRTIDDVTPEMYYNDPVIRQAVDDAVRSTHESLGAFSEMSPWERNVVRQVYPFWAWMKFINKAAVKLAIDNPDRVLFTVALGDMVADPDSSDYFSFLQDMTPVAGKFTDLSFVNPYADAVLFGENPVAKTQEALTGVSPVIRTPLRAGALVSQYATGWQSWPFDSVSQPSYLEGRPGVSRRDVGILAGELFYLALKDWGGPTRNILEMLPSEIPVIAPQGRLIGTDVAVGPGVRFPQGSLRTEGRYAEPRLSPAAQRLGALMRGLGIPGAPIADVALVEEQARLGRIADERARRRKEREQRRAYDR